MVADPNYDPMEASNVEMNNKSAIMSVSTLMSGEQPQPLNSQQVPNYSLMSSNTIETNNEQLRADKYQLLFMPTCFLQSTTQHFTSLETEITEFHKV
eukprot:6113882-Amphidinium_carterae.1